MKKLLIFFFFVLFIEHKKSFPQEIIGVTQELPGMIELDGESLKGPVFQRVRKVLKKLKIKENIQVYPWARTYELAKKNKNYFIFPIAKNTEREKYFKFVGVIFNVRTFVYSRNLSNFKIKNLNDTRNYSVCIVRNDIRDQFLSEKGFTKLVRFADQESVIHGVIAKKCDIAMCAENIEFLWKKKLGQKLNSLVKKSLLIKEIDSKRYLSFNKDTDEEIIKKFTTALIELEK